MVSVVDYRPLSLELRTLMQQPQYLARVLTLGCWVLSTKDIFKLWRSPTRGEVHIGAF